MRIRLFERLRPVCPQCRHALQQDHPLEIDQVLKESDYGLIEGILHCSNPDCQLEYPVIDGIPIIVRDVRSYISNCLTHITIRRDLSGTMDSLLGDCAGAGTHFDVDRQHLSSYAWDHYADLCSDAPRPAGKAETAPTSSVLACMNAGLGLVRKPFAIDQDPTRRHATRFSR